MKTINLFALVLLIVSASCTTQQNLNTMSQEEITQNKAAIMAFYNKALTVNKNSRPTEALTPILANDYKSSSSIDSKGAKQLMGQLEFFWKAVPNLKWEPQTIVSDGDQYVVRSIATGTPNGDFMGIPTNGTKSFKIITMDMHTVKAGKILNTYHVEDWATAIQQLKSETNAKKEDDAMTIANAFMEAMGKGDMNRMTSLMHDDMVWQNAGDKSLPWIGPWNGKKEILEKFLPSFGANFQTIKWEPNDALSSDNTAAYFGQMIGLLTNSNTKTNEFTYALRVKVKDGKVILWNWFEDSYEVSRAFHNK